MNLTGSGKQFEVSRTVLLPAAAENNKTVLTPNA